MLVDAIGRVSRNRVFIVPIVVVTCTWLVVPFQVGVCIFKTVIQNTDNNSLASDIFLPYGGDVYIEFLIAFVS